MIKTEGKKLKYYDKNGVEITEGSLIRYSSGKEQKVYLTENGELGTDATNQKWIESGRAVPCEFGIYPLENEETEEVEVVMDRTTMINEILEKQNRVNDHILTKEKLEKFNFEILSLVYETSKYMIAKL